MNFPLILPELAVIALALALLLADLWTPAAWKARLGYVSAAGLFVILLLTFAIPAACPQTGFDGMIQQDGLALFFQRFFLIAAICVALMGVEFSEKLAVGIGEFHTLVLLALSGMMFAAAANDLVMVFVSLEIISITFYILVSFQRARLASLEAGVKYLILSGISASFLVFGIALIFGAARTTNFAELNAQATTLGMNKALWMGLLMVMVGLGFKIASFPVQMWAPDVYQGAPTPVTAFLAIGSKAAGFVLILRVLFIAFPAIVTRWNKPLIVAAALTILYGNLCAIPQRNLKRLLGYSSIAHAGYLLMGVAAANAAGSAAVLYYLAGYLPALAAAFVVIAVVARDSEDISSFAGLHQRSPVLAACMAIAMISLAGIPPLAGFMGKFLLFKAVVEQGFTDPSYFWLTGVAIVGVVISLYYYFGVVRAMYWSAPSAETAPLRLSIPMKALLGFSVVGMLYLGICPGRLFDTAMDAVKALKF